MNKSLVRAVVLCTFFLSGSLIFAGTSSRDVTFIATSDEHYKLAGHIGLHNDLNHSSIEEINRIADRRWPEQLGGDKIDKPRAILSLGDEVDNGDMAADGHSVGAEEYKFFLADFGLDGTDGFLKYPVFEGQGNHDGPPVGDEKNGFSFQAHLKARNKIRLAKGLISNVSTNGLHYSWDWDDVHFVQLNLYPANKQAAGVRYSPVWHNPQDSLDFLEKDLAEKVGKSGRPVVLMSHCGFDTDWWTKQQWADLYQAMKPYNIVLYIYGHTGTGVRDWAPPGEEKKWHTINDGQTEKGFFVIQIVGDRLRAAERFKSDLVYTRTPGSVTHTWGGNWGWKWILDKKISAPPRK